MHLYVQTRRFNFCAVIPADSHNHDVHNQYKMYGSRVFMHEKTLHAEHTTHIYPTGYNPTYWYLSSETTHVTLNIPRARHVTAKSTADRWKQSLGGINIIVFSVDFDQQVYLSVKT